MPETSLWEPHDGDNLRCRRHGHVFEKIFTCPDCQPSTELVVEDDDEPIAAPTGCKSSQELEATLIEVAYHAWQRAKDCTLSPKGQHAAIKWCEVTLKAVRAAGEYVRTREGRAEVRRLERRARALKNRGAAN